MKGDVRWSGERAWRDALIALHFVRVEDHQPRHTRLIDLDREPDAILADAMGSIRTIHRNHAKKGLEVRSTRNPGDVAVLADFLSRAAGKRASSRGPRCTSTTWRTR